MSARTTVYTSGQIGQLGVGAGAHLGPGFGEGGLPEVGARLGLDPVEGGLLGVEAHLGPGPGKGGLLGVEAGCRSQTGPGEGGLMGEWAEGVLLEKGPAPQVRAAPSSLLHLSLDQK